MVYNVVLYYKCSFSVSEFRDNDKWKRTLSLKKLILRVMKLSTNKCKMSMDHAKIFSLYVVFGALAFVGGLTVLIFAGSYISKSGKCTSFKKKRQATVSNEVNMPKIINCTI